MIVGAVVYAFISCRLMMIYRIPAPFATVGPIGLSGCQRARSTAESPRSSS